MNQLVAKLHQLRQDQVFTWSWRITLFTLASFLFLLVYFWGKLPPTLPFYYSLPWGEEQLTSPFALLISLLGICLLYLVNIIFASLIYHTHRVFAHTLMLGAMIISTLMVFTLMQIVFLTT